jgi:hypothetical protein
MGKLPESSAGRCELTSTPENLVKLLNDLSLGPSISEHDLN